MIRVVRGTASRPADLRTTPDGMGRYLTLRAKKLRMLSEGSITVELDIDGRVHRRARVRVADSGDGYRDKEACLDSIAAVKASDDAIVLESVTSLMDSELLQMPGLFRQH